jgi:DNA polymerase III subunit delta'
MTLKPIELVKIEDYFMNKLGSQREDAKLFSSFSRGNLGKALMLKDSDVFLNQRNDMLKLLDVFINHKECDIMEAVELLEANKEDIQQLLEILISLIRDVLYFKETHNHAGIIHLDIVGRITELSQKAKPQKLVKLVRNSYLLVAELRLNVNFSLAVLTMLTDV